jgi:hypothetical protein
VESIELSHILTALISLFSGAAPVYVSAQIEKRKQAENKESQIRSELWEERKILLDRLDAKDKKYQDLMNEYFQVRSGIERAEMIETLKETFKSLQNEK